MHGSRLKTLMVLAGCAFWLAVLGWIDRATGYELGLFAFYTAPVGVVAWYLGQGTGILVAFIASGIWYLADRYAGDRYSTPFYAYWNTGMHFTTFVINAVTFAKIRSSLDRRHELERALWTCREHVKQLPTPLCPRCHKQQVPQKIEEREPARESTTSQPGDKSSSNSCGAQGFRQSPAVANMHSASIQIAMCSVVQDCPDRLRDIANASSRSGTSEAL